MSKKKVDDVFFQLFCEKNSDGTKHLRLRGKEIFQRYGFRLNHEHVPALTSFLNKNPDVNSIDLAYNEIGDCGLQLLLDLYLQFENKLQYLNLLHCDIGPLGLKWLSRANCTNLKCLRLEGNKLGAEGAYFLGQIIDNCENLEDLDIGETDQTNESIEGILITIEKSSLKSLNISRIVPKTYYTQYNTSDLADNIGVLMKMNDSLEVLRIQKCEFDGHDIEILVDGLRHHNNLVMLDLAANRIGDDGIQYIAKWLRTKPKIIALRLPANNITTKGARILGTGLPFTKIRYLDLQYNRIGREGISVLLYGIRKSTPMRMLFIWGNEFGDNELETLDRLLKAGILEQEYIDVKVYTIGGVKQAAYYPSNRFNHKAYSVSDYGFPPELKIIRNKIIPRKAKPRALIDLDFIDRYPPAIESKNLEPSEMGSLYKSEEQKPQKIHDLINDEGRLIV